MQWFDNFAGLGININNGLRSFVRLISHLLAHSLDLLGKRTNCGDFFVCKNPVNGEGSLRKSDAAVTGDFLQSKLCYYTIGLFTFTYQTLNVFGKLFDGARRQRKNQWKYFSFPQQIDAAAVFAGCGLTGTRIRFGAAGLGGTYHVFADTFAGLITAGKEKCTVEVKTTAGSAANLRLLSDGYIQMAVAQNDLTNDAYYAAGTFENSRKYRGYSAVAALYTESCQIVVRADSGIESMDGLQGKTVSVGENESGTELNAEQILAVSGLTDKLIDKVHLDYTEAAEQLADGKIDAFF